HWEMLWSQGENALSQGGNALGCTTKCLGRREEMLWIARRKMLWVAHEKCFGSHMKNALGRTGKCFGRIPLRISAYECVLMCTSVYQCVRVRREMIWVARRKKTNRHKVR